MGRNVRLIQGDTLRGAQCAGVVTRLNGGDATILMIRRRPDISRHDVHREEMGRAVNDREPTDRIAHVRDPALRHVAKHAEIKAVATRRAVFKQDVGVRGRDPIKQIIKSEHISMRFRARPHIGHIPVHVPFDVIIRRGSAERIEPVKDMIDNLWPGQIKDQLVASKRWVPTGNRDRPIGMGAVEVTVRVDHFRLDPNAKRQAHVLNALGQRRNAGRKAFRIGGPIAKGATIIRPTLEPTIIQHQTLYS